MELDGSLLHCRFKKLVTRTLEFNNKSVEETLLDAGAWALLALRIPGYFPLTICRSNSGTRLELVRCSTVTFYTIIITLISLGGLGFFCYSFVQAFYVPGNSDGPKTQFESTMVFIWFSLMILVTYTTYIRLSRIFFCRGSLKFWQRTVTLLETMVSFGYPFSSCHFERARVSIRRWVVFYFSIATVRIIYQGYNLYSDLIDPDLSSRQMAASYLDCFLAFTMCFHVGYSIWLTFLVKLITICFETVHEDLDGLHLGLEWNRVKTAATANAPTPPPPPVTPISMTGHLGLGYYTSSSTTTTEGDESRNKLLVYLHLEHKIRQTLKTYTLIEEQMHHFNDFFGVSLILEVSFALIILVVNVYCGESRILEDPCYVILVMGTATVIYSSALFNLSSCAALASGRASSILKKLDRFMIPNGRQELQALQLKVLALIARVADNPPTISAAHFFTLNRHLLTAALGTAITNLIVLMQYRDSVPSDPKVAPTPAPTTTASPTLKG